MNEINLNEATWRWCGYHESPCTVCEACGAKSCCDIPCDECRHTQKKANKFVKFALTKLVTEMYGATDNGVPRIDKANATVSWIVLRGRLAEKFGQRPQMIWGRPVYGEHINLTDQR